MTQYKLPLVLAIGAVAVAGLRLAGLSFGYTPLLVGVVALAAAAVSPDPKPWTAGIVTSSWGLGVLLVQVSGISGRGGSVYMIAIGIGVLIAYLVTPQGQRHMVGSGAASLLIAGGFLFFLSFELAWITQWWVFAAGIAAAAAVEAYRANADDRSVVAAR